MLAPLAYRFDHLHLFCSDVDATERWFVEGLGATLVERRHARGVRVSELQLGGAQLLIRGAREGEQLASAGARRFGTDHFGLRVVDLDATVAELRRRGVLIEVEPWDFGPTLRIAFIKGPDDVRIELVQTKEPPTDPDPEGGALGGPQ
jgi:catechol 2,3-dioxygenase-like lactoylglutathione lyase family enzyme